MMKKVFKYLILIFIFLFLSFSFVLVLNDNKLEVDYKNNMHISYPVFSNDIDLEIQKYIENEKEEYIKKFDNSLDSYLTIDYEITSLSYIKTINFKTSTKNYTKYYTIYVDNNTKSVIEFKSLFKEDGYNKLLEILKTYNKDIKEFNNIYFNQNSIDVMFDSKINISFSELKDIFKDDILYINSKRDISKFKDKKLIAFTFDDGPNNKTTLYLLDRLDTYDARVTFFVVGSRVNSHKESLIKAYEQGNQIGNHSYNHPNLSKLEFSKIESEIMNTNEAVKNITGEYPNLIRPPYGSYNSDVKKIANMPIILWNIDTLDWKYKDKDKVAKTIIENAKDGSVILLHDLYQSSVEGALLAMQELYNEGYAFVTIDEMCILKGITLENSVYRNFK
mgnify:FL=1